MFSFLFFSVFLVSLWLIYVLAFGSHSEKETRAFRPLLSSFIYTLKYHVTDYTQKKTVHHF